MAERSSLPLAPPMATGGDQASAEARDEDTPKRKYQMIRLGAGDYLLPSNDGQTLWRLYTYEEEGTLEVEVSRDVTRPVLGTFWAAARRPMPPLPATEDLDDWGRWEFYSGPLPSRKAAIEAALGCR